MKDNNILNYLYLDDLYDESMPFVFTDGTNIYNKLKEQYITHKRGLFIYGPSGIDKTYCVNNQKEKQWINGDVITEQVKKQGFWVLGASCVNIIPDAIVIPDWDTYLKYIKHREKIMMVVLKMIINTI